MTSTQTLSLKSETSISKRHSIFRAIRAVIYQALLFPPINFVGRTLIRLLPSSFSSERAYVFPVRGEIKVSYGSFGTFKMYSEGADSIASRAYFSDAFSNDPAMARTLSALFLSSKSFYDVGANSGLYTLMAMRHSNIKEIHAFDPVPLVFKHLERNIKINNGTNAKAHQLAIGRASGRTTFRIPQGILLPVGSSDQGSQKTFDDSRSIDVDVEIRSIDDFVRAGHLPPEVMKLDTETTEPDVVAGAQDTIKTHRPFIVTEVLTNEVADKLEVFFGPLGYLFFHLRDEEPKPTDKITPNSRFLNYALVPKERVSQYEKNLRLI